ncbi:MAG: hypothetical protein AAGF53_05675 [Pseudomonadota bacterium]
MERDIDKMPVEAVKSIWRAGVTVAVFVLSVFIWSSLAPIASTIRVSGEISSAEPSHDIQHSRGGRLKNVHIQLYDRVEVGDVIFSFDQTEQLLTRDALRQRAELIRSELVEIKSRLASASPPKRNAKHSNALVTRHFQEQDLVYKTRIEAGEKQVEASRMQRRFLQDELVANEELREQVALRLRKSALLVQRGFLPETEEERVRETLLQLDVEIAEQVSEMEALRSEIVSTKIQNDLIAAEHFQSLAQMQIDNERELIGIEAELARIEHEIEASQVVSTTAGMITSLDFDTPNMVAPPGATLAVISQPLAEPKLELRVPAVHIDQVAPGQQGMLTITSLPARNAPELKILVHSVSEEPVKDQEGNALHYLAKATISADDLSKAKGMLDDRFQLFLGMPVSVALAGDSVTLWEFLTEPLVGIWQGAFEE